MLEETICDQESELENRGVEDRGAEDREIRIADCGAREAPDGDRGPRQRQEGALAQKAEKLGLDEEEDVFETTGMMGKRDLWELMDLNFPELRFPAHAPVDHPRLVETQNIFHTLREEGSILVQHPYESFASSVVRLLREASADPKVRAIKMTLYRTSSDSDVIRYLIDAARNGKNVSVVVELRSILDRQLTDLRLGWEMHPDGSYVRRDLPADDDTPGSQEFFMERARRRSQRASKYVRKIAKARLKQAR